MVCGGLKSITTGPTNMLRQAFHRPPVIWTTITEFGFLPDIFLPCDSFSASSTVHTKATVPLPKLHPAPFSFLAHLKWLQLTSRCLASPHQGPPSSPPPESHVFTFIKIWELANGATFIRKSHIFPPTPVCQQGRRVDFTLQIDSYVVNSSGTNI